jgi:predicted RNase H-like nuclease (RuvC/YqgF family)
MSISDNNSNIEKRISETLNKIKRIPLRYYVIVSIIIGSIIGYSINYYLTEPKISNLIVENEEIKKEINSLKDDISSIQDDYKKLEKEYTDLTELYQNTIDNYIPVEEFNNLKDEYSILEEENEGKKIVIETLNEEIDYLTDLNIEIIEEYNKLIKKYNEIRTLNWVYFVVEGLEVNLTTIKTSYTELEDIVGTVTITENNEPFEGQVEFRVWSDLQIAGTSGFSHDIVGETEYSIHNGFIFGPGKYTIGLLKIIDKDGKTIVTIDDLKEYTIPIQMG